MRATDDNSTGVPVFSYLLIDFALLLAVAALGTFAVACIV
jgi:hypothetical protein